MNDCLKITITNSNPEAIAMASGERLISGVVFFVALIAFFALVAWLDGKSNDKDDYCSWR